jgi:hypothetical protein
MRRDDLQPNGPVLPKDVLVVKLPSAGPNLPLLHSSTCYPVMKVELGVVLEFLSIAVPQTYCFMATFFDNPKKDENNNSATIIDEWIYNFYLID